MESFLSTSAFLTVLTTDFVSVWIGFMRIVCLRVWFIRTKILLYIHFYFSTYNNMLTGVLASSQSRTTPIALPYQSVVSVAPTGYACRVIRDTLLKIQDKSDSYLEAEPQ